MPIGQYLDTGILGNTLWDDISLSATSTKVGANAKPDFDYTNVGLLFPQNDTAERVYMVSQMSHKKRLGTSIYLHIHYIQSSANKPVFRAEYRFYNNNSLVPVAYTTINTSDVGGNTGVFTYTTGNLLQIASFPTITPPTGEDLSANIDIILYRTDNVVTGDVLVKYIDIHYEIDSDGSREAFSK